MEQFYVNNQDEISKQFEEFCHTKGIVAKFKVAFANMSENTKKQREADKIQLNKVKQQSEENNKEFTEFLHTKGFKAKVKLVIEDIKKGARESTERTRKQIEETKHGIPSVIIHSYTAEELTCEFNEFLKAKGLNGKYVVEVTEENND